MSLARKSSLDRNRLWDLTVGREMQGTEDQEKNIMGLSPSLLGGNPNQDPPDTVWALPPPGVPLPPSQGSTPQGRTVTVPIPLTSCDPVTTGKLLTSSEPRCPHSSPRRRSTPTSEAGWRLSGLIHRLQTWYHLTTCPVLLSCRWSWCRCHWLRRLPGHVIILTH